MMQEVLNRRRRRVAEAWKNAGLDRDTVAVCAGDPIGVPGGADQTYPFIAHSDYFYLTNVDAPGGVLCYDADDGWRHFVPDVSEAEQMWEGRPPIDWDAMPADTRPKTPAAWGSSFNASRTQQPTVMLGAAAGSFAQSGGPNPKPAVIAEALQHARRVKDEHELAEIRAAIGITAAAFAHARPFIRPGVTERRVQIELEAEMFRRGAGRTAYGSIVGAGSNAAVLHFAPSDRVLKAGDFLLIDAGAEVRRYAADVTRTYPVGEGDAPKFRPHQRELFDAVRRAQQNAIARCVAGAEWKDVHLAAAVDLVDGLVGMGLMNGSPTNLVERETHMLFFPHGLGHMVGLGVRDASGMFPGRARSDQPSLKNLRMDLPLEAGYVVTVEPGVYFIPAILNDPARREKYRDCVDWAKVDWWLAPLRGGDESGGGGGVRLEENILVQPDGRPPEVLTSAIPHE